MPITNNNFYNGGNEMKTELEQLISQIKSETNQIAINKSDEVKVMTAMLNDKDFSLGVYDKKMGYIGQKSPHEEAEKFISDIISRSTGLDKKDSSHLASNFEFTKKDANFLLSNMRDFLQVYTLTGRKINIMQTAATEANLYIKEVPASTKVVPDKDKTGETKTITTSPFIKLVSQSKCPKYN